MEWAVHHDRELGVALFGSAWPLLVETDLCAEGRARYPQVLTLLSDALPRARIGRFWEAIATYDSTRQWDRARYAAELAAAMHAASGDDRSRYYALMQLANNWRVDTAAAHSTFEAARLLEDPAWPARLLTYGALTEGAMLSRRRAVRRGPRRLPACAALRADDQRAAGAGGHGSHRRIGHRLRQHRRRPATRPAARAQPAVHGPSGDANRTAGDDVQRTAARRRDRGGARDGRRTLRSWRCGSIPASSTWRSTPWLYLACEERRYEVAARIAGCADAAHEAHGQAAPASGRGTDANFGAQDPRSAPRDRVATAAAGSREPPRRGGRVCARARPSRLMAPHRLPSRFLDIETGQIGSVDQSFEIGTLKQQFGGRLEAGGVLADRIAPIEDYRDPARRVVARLGAAGPRSPRRTPRRRRCVREMHAHRERPGSSCGARQSRRRRGRWRSARRPPCPERARARVRLPAGSRIPPNSDRAGA